jgi:Dolichyl-phosphate-mannose-protein mannosyltransferase
VTPRGAVAAVIVATFFARLWFASWMGLGIDESYMAATSRHLHWSYYDHPPIAWWLAWAAERVAGPGSDFWIRFPFVALFAFSSWLMFRLSTALYGERAALWAVVLFNVVPVLGITTLSALARSSTNLKQFSLWRSSTQESRPCRFHFSSAITCMRLASNKRLEHCTPFVMLHRRKTACPLRS